MASDPDEVPRLQAEIRALEWRLKDARGFAKQVASIAVGMARDGRSQLTPEEQAICRRARTF